MPKTKDIFACTACGAVHTKWLGKCPDCGAWDSLIAERVETKVKLDPRASAVGAWARDGENGTIDAASNPALPIGSIAGSGDGADSRIRSGINEFDRVAGGGLVPGSAVLLGGDPGIGKSTLLLQVAGALAGRGTKVLYVSSEESAEQIRMRASRLGADNLENLYVLADTSLARIGEQAARVLGGDREGGSPPVLIIDSIQMIYKADLAAFPGSLTQLRQCTAELVFMAKATGATVIMVGHVTKDGMLAGPRMLEHLVDAVLYFEGDRYHAHRVIRAVKNRFGSTLELGLFEMTGDGLREAPAGALAGLGGDQPPRPGTVVCPVMTGTRCLLVEIQALTATGFPGATKRKSSGVDTNRLAMLIAVLEQHAGMRLADRDIFASAVGGIKIAEPGADLALLLAIAGAQLKRAVPRRTAVIGEVGLGGEVRPIAQAEARLTEAAKLGFTHAIVPGASKLRAPTGTKIELIGVRTISEAIDHLA